MSEVVPNKEDKRKPIEVLHARGVKGIRVNIQKYYSEDGWSIQDTRIDVIKKDSRGIC